MQYQPPTPVEKKKEKKVKDVDLSPDLLNRKFSFLDKGLSTSLKKHIWNQRSNFLEKQVGIPQILVSVDYSKPNDFQEVPQ